MEFIPKRRIVDLYPETIEVVLKRVNLAKPGEMDNAISLLRDWVKMQPHFKRRDFSDAYLQSTIIASKGSLEKAKGRMDRLCTLRTLLPQNFSCFDVEKSFASVLEVVKPIILPKLTKEHYRIMVAKPNKTLDAGEINDAFKYTYVMGDYLKQTDCIAGFIAIFDLSDVNMLELMTKINPMDLRQALTVYFEGLGLQLKGLFFITTSKIIDTLIGILKQILKPKLVDRIKIFKSWDDAFEFVEKEIIPVDFGGNEKSASKIHDDWLSELTSDDFKKYLREINTAKTDETCRPSDKFNEEYAGMPGTFRLLSVD
ncbi:uncharacterized protein LOC126967388 [Leptidea sinapis]|uniref:CRAL-TRIO domain-containing protein n=1 Tax=Leptidea sinapis TaxID=189913 RepID=A0A5E4QJA1_9NEOP|nr:uncharacterized protein LOC126967388 [Leptidea sinapis]VVC97781.1 unnamed protein product [Leptidea sinapis]